jgi:pimeloyl-ACP methyl ester carboxylesterase
MASTRPSQTDMVPEVAFSRRSFLAGGAAAGAGLLLDHVPTAQASDSAGTHPIKQYDIATNGITLHVTEQGEGQSILFCHGFPDTSYTWRRQMQAVVSAGYRAIAPDMRGYGRSSAPADAALYTPLQTVGDLVVLLDALHVPSAIIVGHDWGASVAWGAAMMRPDRFEAVFCLTVPYVPRGDVSFFEYMRKSGHQNDFYMFEQSQPEADQIWADAAVTIPGVLYWASGSAPADKRWSPMNPARSLYPCLRLGCSKVWTRSREGTGRAKKVVSSSESSLPLGDWRSRSPGGR